MSSAPSANEIFIEIKTIVRIFNEFGLSNRAFYPILSHENGNKLIHAPNRVGSEVLKNIAYEELYDTLDSENIYLIKLIDGALIQLDYSFDTAGRKLETHRLAFLPSPRLDPFLELEQDYWEGRSFVEVVGHQVMPVPIRIDFDNRPGVHRSVSHPAAHMTLGQYQHCRIPLSAPMRPTAFASFIGMHFYSDTSGTYGNFPAVKSGTFGDSLDEAEGRLTHLRVAGW